MATKRIAAPRRARRKASDVPAKAPSGDAAAAGTRYEGFIAVTIGGKQFIAEGELSTQINVKYHKPYQEAIDVGTVTSLVGEIGSLIPGGNEIGKKMTGAVDWLKSEDGALKVVGTFLDKADIRIYHLEIDTASSTYGLGIAFDLRNAGAEFHGIKLDAIGLTVVHKGEKPNSAGKQ